MTHTTEAEQGWHRGEDLHLQIIVVNAIQRARKHQGFRARPCHCGDVDPQVIIFCCLYIPQGLSWKLLLQSTLGLVCRSSGRSDWLQQRTLPQV